jgi:hypothetical protein
MRVVAIEKRCLLTFEDGSTSAHDAVVLAIPATVIRARVALDANLGIAPGTSAAISGLQDD